MFTCFHLTVVVLIFILGTFWILEVLIGDDNDILGVYSVQGDRLVAFNHHFSL